MTLCLACCLPGPVPLCGSCRDGLRAAVPRRLTGGLVVTPAFVHRAAARVLVHRLKYSAVAGVAGLLAAPMVRCLPGGAAALVPVPRVWTRRLRFGVDPARELAGAMGRLTGLPVVDALLPPLWHPRHAGRPRRSRPMPHFRPVGPVPVGAVIVDDVLTTGATILAAARAVGANRAVTATGVGV